MSSSDSIETTASTIDQAISQALAQLGAEQDDVTIEVLSTPRSGVLGLGARQARVRVTKRAREGAHSGVMSPPPAPPLRATPPEMRRPTPEARPDARREPAREPMRQERSEVARDARSDSPHDLHSDAPREPRREPAPHREGGEREQSRVSPTDAAAPRDERRGPERNASRAGPRTGRGDAQRQEALASASADDASDSGRSEKAPSSGNREGGSRGGRGRGRRRQSPNAEPRAQPQEHGAERRDRDHDDDRDPFATVDEVGNDPRKIVDLQEQAREATIFLERLLELMGEKATIEHAESDDPETLELNIKGDGSGILIGRHGQTLDAIEYMVNRLLARKIKDAAPISIDTESYRARRRRLLQRMALSKGEQAKREHVAVTLDPMPPRDRRIVHLALKDDPMIATRSTGDGFMRAIEIVPVDERRNPSERGGENRGRGRGRDQDQPPIGEQGGFKHGQKRIV